MCVICSLVFGCGLRGLSGNLFEEGKDSEGSGYRRLVEERWAILESESFFVELLGLVR